MCLRCLTLFQTQVFGNILSIAIGIALSVLMFQIFTRISHFTARN